MVGIDVSEHNGKLDWPNISCDFSIIRGGYGSGDVDSEFERNIERCTVPFGIYWFSYAYTVERAKIEARKLLEVLTKLKKAPILPVFFDWEYDSDRYAKQNGVSVDKGLYSQMACAFMDEIKAAGHKAGNYYNNDYLKNYCDDTVLDKSKYYQWYAYYGDESTFDCDIWQYTENGAIDGFAGDINILKNESLLKKEPVMASRILQTGVNQITYPYGGSHGGVDVVKEHNELDGIIAHTAGQVIMCQSGRKNDTDTTDFAAYGNFVRLRHANGFTSLYAHLDSVNVKKDDRVKLGQKIGFMGNTGKSFGAHLHFEVKNAQDVRIDPTPYIATDLPQGAAEKCQPGTYKITADVLTVRKGPGTEYDWVPYNSLTPNAKTQIKSLADATPNGYVKDMVCDVSEVSGDWGKTPSGWICLDFCKEN